MAEWEPIAITSKDAVDVEGDQVRVVWSLSRRPDIDWAREFRDSTTRNGSAGLEHTSPDIRIGGTIQWIVPATELRAAAQYVKSCVALANEGYARILVRRDEARRRREEEERARAVRLHAAQQALNELD